MLEIITERWEHDAAGNVVLHENPAGLVTLKSYDANHNLLSERPIDLDYEIKFHYDWSDRLTKKASLIKSPILMDE